VSVLSFADSITGSFLSYAVYLGIIAGYFVFIYTVFPETKRLTAEEAATVFDKSRHGRAQVAEVEPSASLEVDSAEGDEKYQGSVIHGVQTSKV